METNIKSLNKQRLKKKIQSHTPYKDRKKKIKWKRESKINFTLNITWNRPCWKRWIYIKRDWVDTIHTYIHTNKHTYIHTSNTTTRNSLVRALCFFVSLSFFFFFALTDECYLWACVSRSHLMVWITTLCRPIFNLFCCLDYLVLPCMSVVVTMWVSTTRYDEDIEQETDIY